MKITKHSLADDYYQKIKKLNVVHYAGEVSYYSKAELRPAELKFLNELPKGSKILDVGCGSGRFSIQAAKLGFEVTGIDITPAAIESCRNRVKKDKISNINFMVADITEVIPKDKYDYVFCPRFVINAIATDDKRRKAIVNMCSACKANGRIFIESFNILYLGQGISKPVTNVIKSISRSLRIKLAELLNMHYSGLYPGDITYPANKAKGASDGYAHLPSIFEVKSYLKGGKTQSIYEILGLKKKDWLKPFRYSIWITKDV